MSGPVPTLGHRSRSAAAVALRAEGYTHADIARRLGVHTCVVGALIASGLRARRPIPPVGTITITLDAANAVRLSEAAAARGISQAQLASRIVAAAVMDGIVNAILDDGDQP